MSHDLASLYIKVDSSGVVTASKDLNKLTGESRTAEKATDSLNAGFGRLKGMVAGLATAYAGLQLARFVTDVVQAQVTMERMTVALKSATGSAQAAAEGMAYVRSESQRLGLSLQDQGKAYTKLAAASKGTSLEGKATQDIFTAISEASTALSLSADESAGALYAIGQMMSKGTVQAEELRGQLGERLPGAFQVAAKAMGVSTAELGKMLEQGKVMSDDFLPKFAAALRQHYAGAIADASQSTSSNLNRMKTAIFEAKVALGQAFGSATQDSVKSMTSAVEKMKAEMETPEAKRAISELSAEFAKLIENAGTKAPDAIRSTISALNGIMTFYNSLPSFVIEAAGMGIVGRMLFGVGPGKIIAAISVINTALEKLGMNIGSLPGKFKEGSGAMQNVLDVIMGRKDWNTGKVKGIQGGVRLPMNVDLNGPDIDKMIAGLGGEWDSATTKTTTKTELSTAAKKAISDYERLVKKAREFKKTLEASVETDGMGDFRKELADNAAEAEKLKREYAGLKGQLKEQIYALIEQEELRKNNLATAQEQERQQKAAAEAAKKTSEAEQELLQIRQEAEEKLRLTQEQAISSRLYELDLAELAGESYRKQIEERIKLEQQLLDIDNERLSNTDKVTDYAAYDALLKAIQEHRKNLLSLKNTNQEVVGSFNEGWNKAWQEWTDKSLTMFTAGKQMALDTANAMQDAFSTYFFDIIEGRFNSLSDILKSFSHAINQALANALGNMATNYVYNGLNSTLNSLVGAGVSMIGGMGGSSSTPSGYTDSGSGYQSTSSFGTGSGSTFGNWEYRADGGPVELGKSYWVGEKGTPELFTPRTSGYITPLDKVKQGISGGLQSMSISVPITINGSSKVSASDVSGLRDTVEGVVERWIKDKM